MFEKLKDKWQVGWLQFSLIFITFALGGSLCARVGNILLTYFLPEESILYWILYIPLVTVLWPLSVLLISLPLGQFQFFIRYIKKIALRMGLRKRQD